MKAWDIFLRAVALLVLCLASIGGMAADAGELRSVRSAYCDFVYEGQVASGDAALFDRFGGPEPVRVCFDSPGGSIAEGARMLEVLWERNVITVVPPGAVCESACALAFMGGSIQFGTGVVRTPERVIYPGGRLGIHGPGLALNTSQKYDAGHVNSAFQSAIKAVAQVQALSMRREQGVQAVPDFFVTLLLNVPSHEMYVAERISDLILLDIRLGGVALPATLSNEAALNICKNGFVKRKARDVQQRAIHSSIGHFLHALDPLHYMAGKTGAEAPYSFMNNLEIELDGRRGLAWVGAFPSGSKYVRGECLVTLEAAPDFGPGPSIETVRGSNGQRFAADLVFQPYDTQHGAVSGQAFDNAKHFEPLPVPVWHSLPFGKKIAGLGAGLAVDWR